MWRSMKELQNLFVYFSYIEIVTYNAILQIMKFTAKLGLWLLVDTVFVYN